MGAVIVPPKSQIVAGNGVESPLVLKKRAPKEMNETLVAPLGVVI